MVRVKVSVHPQTKQFEWKILDEKGKVSIEIETPGHNLLILRNLFLSLDSKHEGTCRVLEDFVHDDFLTTYAEEITQYPLMRYLHIASQEADEQISIYHPILDKIVIVNEEHINVVHGLIAVHIDILIRVLQFDDEKRKLACLEHSVTRLPVATELAGMFT